MEEVILSFIFKGEVVKMQCNSREYLKDIFKRYISKIDKEYNDVFFYIMENK